MKPPAEERLNMSDRLRFYADVTALDFLSVPEALTRLEGAVASLDPRDQRNFLRGYRLAVATPFQGLLRFVVDRGELLGLESDDRLSNWLNFRIPPRGESLLSAVSDPTSRLGLLCCVFNDLTVALSTAEGGLDATLAVVENCRAFAALFDELLTGAEIVSLKNGKPQPDRESLARLCIAERVLDYIDYDRSIVPIAYSSVWSGGEELRPADDSDTLRADTHLSNISQLPFSRRVPTEWLDGLHFGFTLVINLSGVSLPSYPGSRRDIPVGPDWVKELRSFVNPGYPETRWPSMAYGLTQLGQFNSRSLLAQFEVNLGTASPRHRLAAVLGSDEVRLMTDAGSTDTLELEVMLGGAIAALGDSKVHLLLLTHSVDSDERQWVSIAFRLPIYGFFSNASKWYLFHKLYHVGDVFDTDVARANKAVEELLQRFNDNLEVEMINAIHSKDFLHLCTLPAFRAMRELSQRAVDTNADLRAGNSELLAAFWLVGQGCRDVRVSFKHASLGKLEYDAIGVKDGQCLVVEITGANIVDRKLHQKIGKFAEKIDGLQKQLPALRRALRSDSNIDDVSGLFIYLGDIDHFEAAEPSISVLSYDDFVEALKAIGLPERIVDLLDKSHIIHSVGTGDFLHDPFFAGLKNSSEVE